MRLVALPPGPVPQIGISRVGRVDHILILLIVSDDLSRENRGRDGGEGTNQSC